MRADRLISMLMLLQTRGRMTADDLAERLEVSTRTIYRDLEALSISGVPVYSERGPSGGIELLENYRTNLTGLTKQEVQALFMFTVPGLFADLKADKTRQAAGLKLMAALPSPFRQDVEFVRQRIHLDPAGWFQPDEPNPFLCVLQEAIWENRRVRMTYRKADGEWVKRLIEPLGLVNKANVWYVVANVFRTTQGYRVSRIQDLALLQSTFERPPDFDLAQFWQAWCSRFEANFTQFEVTLRASPEGILHLAQSFGELIYSLIGQTHPDDQGFTTLSLTFESAEAACRQLLGLGTSIEVQTPPELREMLLAQSRTMVSFYETTQK